MTAWKGRGHERKPTNRRTFPYGLQVYMRKPMYDKIRELIDSGSTPYRSFSDFVRQMGQKLIDSHEPKRGRR
jgi:hypothetical protein